MEMLLYFVVSQDSNLKLIEHRVLGEGAYPTIINKRRTGRLSSSAYVYTSACVFITTERALPPGT